ncbi:hypothetical protein [Streptomyces sp. ALI-76-A]|uniref:hypothetical protein n=1 Tax=Streptomyces sp. ALI-76-A TaxID=3025736 RepID=UPI00256EF47D|nr:hypothetical protein [Streptomyces sp. ALI-76-A]MDL5204320.1 hypothetical protein [Streptomyces sp. ALI-76-A]
MNGPSRDHATPVPAPTPGDTPRATSHDGTAGRLPRTAPRRPAPSGAPGTPIDATAPEAVNPWRRWGAAGVVSAVGRGRVAAGVVSAVGPAGARVVSDRLRATAVVGLAGTGRGSARHRPFTVPGVGGRAGTAWRDASATARAAGPFAVRTASAAAAREAR